MDSPSISNRFDIFEIYLRYCEIRSQNVDVICRGEDFRQGDGLQKAKFSREALAELLKFVESTVHAGFSVFDELFKLMSTLNLMGDFSEFSRFYDFVFFMCRENGQKNITVSKAVAAWRLALAGRFRLLNQWCDFVEKNQRHNISEDTWQQVLAFSRCVHENLEGYDPEGAWPVLIDEFVEHMYRVLGSNDIPNSFCTCGDSDSHLLYEDPLPGLKIIPGLKRKLPELQNDELESHCSDAAHLNHASNSKRNRQIGLQLMSWEDDPPSNSGEDCMEIVKPSSLDSPDHCMEIVRHSDSLASPNPSKPCDGCMEAGKNNSQLGSSPPCAVEGCLSKGFAGLFSRRTYLRFDQEGRVSST